MIYWYDHLYTDDVVRGKEHTFRKVVEERSKWQNLPWKKSYYLLVLASNQENLFEIVNTNQMFFRYYEYTNM